MKRQRRHELQHNDLAAWILKAYERTLPYKNALLGVGLLVVVLVMAMSFWHSHNITQAGEAWGSLVFQPQFAAEQTLGELQKTIQTYPGTPAAEWALVFQGDTALMIGSNRILTEKKVGIERLSLARDFYKKALDSKPNPAAKEQAMFGQARALESLIQNKEDLDNAVAAYQDLNKSFPQGMYKPVAEQRIEQLQKKEALAFYEELAHYTPKAKVQSPRSQLGNLGPLEENPPEEPTPQAPVRPDGSQPGPLSKVPEPSLTPTLTPTATAPMKPEAKKEPTKPEAAKPEAPKKEPAKLPPLTPDAPTAETPKADAPKTETPKKDK